jgi:hypothetical protein
MPFSQEEEARLKAVLDQHRSWIMAQPGIQGCAIGLDPQDRLSIKVYTTLNPPEASKRAVRDRLKGNPVAFEAMGTIRAR